MMGARLGSVGTARPALQALSHSLVQVLDSEWGEGANGRFFRWGGALAIAIFLRRPFSVHCGGSYAYVPSLFAAHQHQHLSALELRPQ